MARITPPQPGVAERLNAFLNQRQSPMAGLGETFVKYGQQYGVDPRLMVAISGAETSFATDPNAGKDITSGHNAWGWGPHIPFPDWRTAIESVAKGLKTGYIDQGLKSIGDISRKWAPVGASNDPTGLNQSWVNNVSKYYEALGGDPDSEVSQYVQKAVALEQQYSGVGMGGAANSAPELSAPSVRTPTMSSDVPTPVPGSLLSMPLTDRAMQGAPAPVSKDRGSNAEVVRLLNQKLTQTMAADAGKVGLNVEVDHSLPISPNAPAIVKEAVKYLGTPYVWGGESPKGFDCSGFAQYVYAQQGITIPRTTYEQWKIGAPVDRDQLAPGDLMFFRPGPQGPEHEGIYIGNGQFIQSPKTGDVVKISSINDSYYVKTYMGARRPTTGISGPKG